MTTEIRNLRIEMDRGNGWELRAEGPSESTMAQVKAALPGYAIKYPHRALIEGHLIVAPVGGRLEVHQVYECHAYAGDNGATIEFLP